MGSTHYGRYMLWVHNVTVPTTLIAPISTFLHAFINKTYTAQRRAGCVSSSKHTRTHAHTHTQRHAQPQPKHPKKAALVGFSLSSPLTSGYLPRTDRTPYANCSHGLLKPAAALDAHVPENPRPCSLQLLLRNRKGGVQVLGAAEKEVLGEEPAGIRLCLAYFALVLPRQSPVHQIRFACLLRFSLIPQPTRTGTLAHDWPSKARQANRHRIPPHLATPSGVGPRCGVGGG